jgi:hypothetical protein
MLKCLHKGIVVSKQEFLWMIGGYNMAKMTEKEMKTILQNEIPLDLEVDSGIFEFHECENVSIGVSYEHVGLGTHCVGYIFNLFVNGEYINIPSSYNNIYEATKVLTDEWNRWQ